MVRGVQESLRDSRIGPTEVLSRAVVDAIAAREPARAGTAARARLTPATDALLEMCAALIADDPEERDG